MLLESDVSVNILKSVQLVQKYTFKKRKEKKKEDISDEVPCETS